MSLWNTANLARRRRAWVACLTGAALVMLWASLAEAEYGPRTKIGKLSAIVKRGVSDRDRSKLLQRSQSLQCLVPGGATAEGADRSTLTCRATVSAGALRYGILQARTGQTFPYRYTDLPAVMSTGGTYWFVNTPAMHLIKPGERPIIHLFGTAAANWQVSCRISGTLQ